MEFKLLFGPICPSCWAPALGGARPPARFAARLAPPGYLTFEGVGESHKSFVLLMLLILTLSDDHPSSDVQHVQTRIYRVIPFRVMPYRSLKGSRKWIHLKPAVNGSFHVPSGKPLLRRGLRGVAELGQLNAVDPGEEQIPHKRTT